jgi:hypothetical protein
MMDDTWFSVEVMVRKDKFRAICGDMFDRYWNGWQGQYKEDVESLLSKCTFKMAYESIMKLKIHEKQKNEIEDLLMTGGCLKVTHEISKPCTDPHDFIKIRYCIYKELT